MSNYQRVTNLTTANVFTKQCHSLKLQGTSQNWLKEHVPRRNNQWIRTNKGNLIITIMILPCLMVDLPSIMVPIYSLYCPEPLTNRFHQLWCALVHKHNYAKSPSLLGTLTPNGHIQERTVKLPEGIIVINSRCSPFDIPVILPSGLGALHKVEVGAEAVCSGLGSMAWLVMKRLNMVMWRLKV